jgi:hypothetical protein
MGVGLDGQWWVVLFVCTTAEFDTIEEARAANAAEEAKVKAAKERDLVRIHIPPQTQQAREARREKRS